MRILNRISIGSFAVAVALMGGMATGAHMPTAAAATKPMNINASGGDGTHIVSDGTQGTETDSVQGVKDSDGDQDAFDAIRSEDVTPQFKANNKMTK